MNLPVFIVFKAEKDPQKFINIMWKILKAMPSTEVEGVEIVSYQFKDITNIWYNYWEESHREDVEPTIWG